MPKAKGINFRCRACGETFKTKPTPNRAALVKCPKCGSEDVEFVSP